MSVWTSAQNGLLVAKDSRHGSCVVRDPSKNDGCWVFDVKSQFSCHISGVQPFLVGLGGIEEAERAAGSYLEWLAAAPAERARREQEEEQARARREEQDAKDRAQRLLQDAQARARREALEIRARQEELRLAEEAMADHTARQQVAELLSQLGLQVEVDAGVPPLPLLHVLIRWRDGKPIGKVNLKMLRDVGLPTLAAKAHEEQYRLMKDPWDLIGASACYRDAGSPRLALEVTAPLLTANLDNTCMAALLTTRGGAFRDLHEPHTAIDLGNAALELVEKEDGKHAYNLLGGAHFDLGDYARADSCFAMASPSGSAEAMWRAEIRNASADRKSAAAAYLIGMDPVGYGWARIYLR